MKHLQIEHKRNEMFVRQDFYIKVVDLAAVIYKQEPSTASPGVASRVRPSLVPANITPS